MPSIDVPSRFNGPPSSGQGGYSSALLAAQVDGPAAVSLRRPVPLDQALEIEVEADAARAFDAAGELIAEAERAPALAPWDAPTIGLDQARAAAARFTPPADGNFDRCFVCGRDRHDDGFHLFPGPVEGTDLVASPWTPPAWAADEDGVVGAEFVWGALDCPGYFAIHVRDLALAFLARMQSELLAPIRAGVEYVAVGRPLRRDGRKGFAATAIADPDGTVLAHSEQLLVMPREAMSQK
jgi:hypothetical protein